MFFYVDNKKTFCILSTEFNLITKEVSYNEHICNKTIRH